MTVLKCVLHVHSDWSYDGTWPLRRIARLYGALGIDAVLMTEHDTGFDPARFGQYVADCAAASGRCRLVPGIEYSSPDNEIHVLTWGLGEMLPAGQPVDRTLAGIRACGGVAVLAHPVRRDAWKRFDPAWTEGLSAIELWNRKSDGLTWSEPAWTLIRETGLPATVGQDFHRLKQLYPLVQHIEIGPGEELEPGVVAALRDGRSVPKAFGAPLLPAGAAGPATRPHTGLERLRRRLKAAARSLRATLGRRGPSG